MIKRIISCVPIRMVLTWTATQYFRFVWLSGRWRIIGDEVPERLVANGRPFIVAFWHGRLIMMAFSWNRSSLVHMLISGHLDGQLVSDIVAHFGSKTVYGSSSRGGAAAFIQLARLLRNGQVVGITPDGPRGPRMRANEGVIALAKVTGAPILPLTYSASLRHIFGSWDRFVLPFPFGRGVFLWGQPIYVARDSDDFEIERKRIQLETTLLSLTQRSDWMMNKPDINPAPADVEDR